MSPHLYLMYLFVVLYIMSSLIIPRVYFQTIVFMFSYSAIIQLFKYFDMRVSSKFFLIIDIAVETISQY